MLRSWIRNVAHALLRAASALMPTHGFLKRSHECERGTHECVRYVAVVTCFCVCAFAEPADWIYSARYVVTMDAQHRLIGDGAVAIRGERIVGVGTRVDINRQFQAAHHLDRPEAVLMP